MADTVAKPLKHYSGRNKYYPTPETVARMKRPTKSALSAAALSLALAWGPPAISQTITGGSGGGGGGVINIIGATSGGQSITVFSPAAVASGGTTTETLASQTSATVLAGPVYGSPAGEPSFRALGVGDIASALLSWSTGNTDGDAPPWPGGGGAIAASAVTTTAIGSIGASNVQAVLQQLYDAEQIAAYSSTAGGTNHVNVPAGTINGAIDYLADVANNMWTWIASDEAAITSLQGQVQLLSTQIAALQAANNIPLVDQWSGVLNSNATGFYLCRGSSPASIAISLPSGSDPAVGTFFEVINMTGGALVLTNTNPFVFYGDSSSGNNTATIPNNARVSFINISTIAASGYSNWVVAGNYT